MSQQAYLAFRPRWQARRHAIRLRQPGRDPLPSDPPAHLLLADEIGALLPAHHLPPSEAWCLAALRMRGAHRCRLAPHAGLSLALEVVVVGSGSHGLHALITIREAALALADEQWRAAERLEAVVGACAALAHRGNNHLACMQSNAEWLAEMSELPLEAITAARGILSGVTKWERMTSRMGRLSAALRPRQGQCDPALLVAGLAQRLRPGLPPHVELGLHAPPGQGLLLADGLGLERALEELMANAVQAVGARGNVDLTVGERPGWRWPGFAWLAVSVTDDGPGIADSAIDAANEGRVEGIAGARSLSLGLLMARAFAQGLGGQFLAERVLWGGTRVTLLLPVLQAAEALDQP